MPAKPRPPALQPPPTAHSVDDRPESTAGATPHCQVTMAALLLSRHDAASVLSVSVRTIDRLVTEGSLRCVRIGGRCLFRRSQLDQFVNGLPESTGADQVPRRPPPGPRIPVPQ